MKKFGFTLIELMVVMVIIGVLSMIGINSFASSQRRSRDTKRKSDLANVQKALDLYYNDYNGYPKSNADGEIECKENNVVCDWGQEFSDDKGTIYMIRLPAESVGSRRYYYVSADGKSYQLYAALENDQDSAFTIYDGPNCAAAGCSYGVASVNATP